jgi:hypothetical protein
VSQPEKAIEGSGALDFSSLLSSAGLSGSRVCILDQLAISQSKNDQKTLNLEQAERKQGEDISPDLSFFLSPFGQERPFLV